VALSACSATPDGSQSSTGQVELALQSTVDGKVYELRGANFEIDGEVALSLESEQAEDDEQLTTELPVGSYTVELRPGWSLYQVSANAEQLLNATLNSVNPAAFTISSGATTEVAYRFAVNGASVELGDGQLAVTIDVDVQAPVSVFFTELMKNPEAVPDSEGEYIELGNAGTEAFSLQGCTVSRDTQSFTIESALNIAAGDVVVLANSAAPGFIPDYVYSSLTLPNSGNFVMTLTCNGQAVDTVNVNAKEFPVGTGKSLSLSSTAWSAAANDVATNWCDAPTQFGQDYGSPGEVNPACPAN
jgi:hypothetical protein